MSAPTLVPTPDYRDLQRRSAQARSVNKLERRIRELVDSPHGLSFEQRSRLAALLRAGTAA